MRYKPKERPTPEVARQVLIAIGDQGIILHHSQERTDRIRDIIDSHFTCKKANDYKHALYQCFLVCERIPRNPAKGGAPYSTTYVHKLADLPDNLPDEDKKIFETIRIFYDAMMKRLKEGCKGKDRQTRKELKVA